MDYISRKPYDYGYTMGGKPIPYDAPNFEPMKKKQYKKKGTNLKRNKRKLSEQLNLDTLPY